MQRTLYEAETAFLTDYQELKNNQACLTAICEEDARCSGGMKAAWLGQRATNDLVWHDVYVEKSGRYALRIAALTDVPRKVSIDINGTTAATLTYMGDGEQTVIARLKKGHNIVRLHNGQERMADIDYMTVGKP